MYMFTVLKKIIFVLVIALYSTGLLISQEIEATVSLNIDERLASEQVQRVESLKYDLEEYINSQSFSGETWEGPKIPVNLMIQLSPVNPNNTSPGNVYAANLFIVSKRSILGDNEATSVAMKFIDKKWMFEYSQSSAMSYDPRRFDVLTSLIDFYMLIIIGLDVDSYGELDGDVCFRKASEIFNIGANAMAEGWESYSQNEYGRQTIIRDLTNPRLDNFRKLIFEYYIDGMDMLATDKNKALDNIAATISKMADFKEKYIEPSNLMDSFMYTKSQEIAELLNGYTKNPKVFRDLMYLDASNTPLYESARDGKLKK